MLVTSPSFIFLFLPLSLLFYALAGKKRRRPCLAAIFFFYHFLLNLKAPLNMLYLPTLILYTYISGRTVNKHKSRLLCVILCALPYAALFTLRSFAHVGIDGFVYPTGFTVAVLSSTSYVYTQHKQKDGMLGNPLDLALYLLFFPIMIAGPVITYSSFAMITKEESISFDISRAASGIRIFAVGFIKRIAIGAVLFKSYSFLVSFSNDSPNILLVLIMLILVYTAVFFTISGYADMGVGLARIYGISLNYKGASNPFRIPTITEYFRITFRGLSEWVDETLVEPTLSLTKGKAPYIVRTVFYSITSILFVRSTLSSLALIVPMLILFYATFRGQLERRLSTRTGLRALCSLTTILAVAILWVFTLIGDFNSFTSYFSGLTGTNPEYYLDKIFLSVSALKYLFVILITALIIWMSRIEEHLDAPTASPGRVYATVQYIAPILTLILFITTILFFLPQFSVYDTVPFTKLFV